MPSQGDSARSISGITDSSVSSHQDLALSFFSLFFSSSAHNTMRPQCLRSNMRRQPGPCYRPYTRSLTSDCCTWGSVHSRCTFTLESDLRHLCDYCLKHLDQTLTEPPLSLQQTPGGLNRFQQVQRLLLI